MTKQDVIEMYLDWAYRRDKNISQSEVLIACYENGFDYEEISQNTIELNVSAFCRKSQMALFWRRACGRLGFAARRILIIPQPPAICQ